MSQQPVVYPYLARFPGLGAAGLAPLLPVTLEVDGRQANLHGLLDSGAMLNVLPQSAGVHLGFDWHKEQTPITVGGTLAGLPAKLVFVQVMALPFHPISMPFAWLDSDRAPLLFGQVTFFEEFDVCFFRKRRQFQIAIAQGP